MQADHHGDPASLPLSAPSRAELAEQAATATVEGPVLAVQTSTGMAGADSPFAGVSPLDGEPLPAVEATPVASIAAMVARAREAQADWSGRSVRARADAMAKLKRSILARADEIALLARRECGKPLEEAALAEVVPTADLFDHWCSVIEELLEPETLELDPLAYPGKLGRTHRVPRGVLGLITPWNYPVAIPLRTMVPALLAGNAVMLKPSEITPRCGALVASLFDGLGVPGLVQVVQGGGDAGRALIEAGVDVVAFTGSVTTGRRVAVACAERFVPCSLELGGKDAAIVLDDCDVERTARGLVWGAFTNAGQNCASIERAFVVKGVAQRLLARVVELTRALRPGIDMGVLTTAAQARVVRAHVEEALARGAALLAGALPDDATSLAIPPIVLRVESDELAVMRDETFGPVLPMMVVNDADEAIRRANDCRYGLTTSIWTRRTGEAQRIARRLESGVVTINNHGFTAALPAAPWTGVRDTGVGVTNSVHALAELTRPRFVLEDSSRAKAELWWHPYTPTLRSIAFAMAKLRGGAGLMGRLRALFTLLGALPRRLLGRDRS